jgi:hypothetical protein
LPAFLYFILAGFFREEVNPAVHRVEHVAKIGWFKKRNSPEELNYVFLGNLLLVSIFSFWDENYRSLIALELSIAKERH